MSDFIKASGALLTTQLPTAPIATLGIGDVVGSAFTVQNNYIYMPYYNNAANRYLDVIDVSNPYNPTVTGTYDPSGANIAPYSVTVQGKYAYLPNYKGDYFTVLDISDAAHPTLTSNNLVFSLFNASYIYIRGRYAYVTFSEANILLKTIDISDPVNPVVLNTLTIGSGFNHIVGQGDYLYINNSGTADAALRIYKIADTGIPSLSGTITYTSGNDFGVFAYVKDQYLYMVQNFENQMRIYNVKDATAPTLVSTSTVSTNHEPITGDGSPMTIHVQGNLAVIAQLGEKAVQFWNIKNPTSPVLLGSVGTKYFGYGAQIYGNYLYAVSQNYNGGGIINGTGTLQIYDLSGTFIQQLICGTLECDHFEVHGSSICDSINVKGGAVFGGSFVSNGDSAVTGNLNVTLTSSANTLKSTFLKVQGPNGASSSIDANAIVDFDDTHKGLLIPRSSYTAISNVISPTEGLTFYDNDHHTYDYWNGSIWSLIVSGMGVNTTTANRLAVWNDANGSQIKDVNVGIKRNIETIAIGFGVETMTLDSSSRASIWIGQASSSTLLGSQRNIVIGQSNDGWENVNSTENVVVGYGLAAGSGIIGGAIQFNTVMGNFVANNNGTSSPTFQYNTLLGYRTAFLLTSGSYNVIVGGTKASATSVLTTGSSNILLGFASEQTLASSSSSNIAIIGGDDTLGNGRINDIFLGRGMVNASANLSSVTIHPTDVSAGTDQNASSSVLIIAGSRGTGTGAGGQIQFQTAPAGTTGSSQNTLQTIAFFDQFGNQTNNFAVAQKYQRVNAPGTTLTINNNISDLVIHDTATITTLTITMPSTPIDGQIVVITSNQNITSLTISPNGGQTITTNVTALTAGNSYAFIYVATDTNWYPWA